MRRLSGADREKFTIFPYFNELHLDADFETEAVPVHEVEKSSI